MMQRTCLTSSIGTYLIALLGLVVGAANSCRGAEQVSLPAADKWKTEAADVRMSEDATEVVAPINYKIVRVVSPAVPAQPGGAFTIAADVRTRFASNRPAITGFGFSWSFFGRRRPSRPPALPNWWTHRKTSSFWR